MVMSHPPRLCGLLKSCIAQCYSKSVKIYLPISFLLTFKVNAMEFGIEKRESFQIIGLSGYEEAECKEGDTLIILWREFMIRRICVCGIMEVRKNIILYHVGRWWHSGFERMRKEQGLWLGWYKGKILEGMSVEIIPAVA